MLNRLATMFLVATLLISFGSPSVSAQEEENATLKGIGAVAVVVENLPESAKALGLTKEAVQTDVELKLRLAGMRVVAGGQGQSLPGDPYVYVNIDLTEDGHAADAEVDLAQNTRLVRNDEFAPGVVTWRAGFVASSPTVQSIRDGIKDLADKFLSAWLSVNPKK